MRSLGVIVESPAFLRDTVWGNLRRATVKTFADQKKTGAQGGEWTELDDVIMDIEGRETANVMGVGVPDLGSNSTPNSLMSNSVPSAPSSSASMASHAAIMQSFSCTSPSTDPLESTSHFVPVPSTSPRPIETFTFADSAPPIPNRSISEAQPLPAISFTPQLRSTSPTTKKLVHRKKRKVDEIEHLFEDGDFKNLKKKKDGTGDGTNQTANQANASTNRLLCEFGKFDVQSN
ncbi:uncharacterized protein LOC131892326 [Tigriopus californicus]|nr:uncharacterized protein LOC131892326 [Tigriopus californicus]